MPGAPTTLSTEPVHVRCETCAAEIVVAAHMRTSECPYCASSAVVDRRATAERPEPTFVAAFGVGGERARAAVQTWLARRRFAPARMRTAALEHMRAVYVPAYLYNAVAHSTWQAEIGEDYTVTETYVTKDASGKSSVHTRQVTKTEHRPLRGRCSAYLVDVLVSASQGLANAELEALEEFDLRALRRYDPRLLAGSIAEEATLARSACLALARTEAEQRVERKLAALMPGDSHRALAHETTFEGEAVDLVLLPVWVLALRARSSKTPVRVLVNGQTGEVCGRCPRSWSKILGLALAIFAGLALLLWSAQRWT